MYTGDKEKNISPLINSTNSTLYLTISIFEIEEIER